jgi:hypothetical protein
VNGGAVLQAFNLALTVQGAAPIYFPQSASEARHACPSADIEAELIPEIVS